jgi:hypothetical protein
MAQAISMDLRSRVIKAIEGGWSCRAAADKLRLRLAGRRVINNGLNAVGCIPALECTEVNQELSSFVWALSPSKRRWRSPAGLQPGRWNLMLGR